MSKQITITYEDRDYTLEYTKATVKQMERAGFNIDKVGEQLMTGAEDLFAGAFLAHHKYVKADKVEKIYDAIKDKKGLVGKLTEMYYEPYVKLFDPEEGSEDEGNVDWTASW